MNVEKNKHIKLIYVVGGIFALSGAAALFYQIVWQRLLFLVFGVDIESVTVIVTVFMMGLGFGGLLGGAIADRWRAHCIPIFLSCELFIGVFGVFSKHIIDQLHFVDNLFLLFLQTSFLLLIPTSLMGATLPLLSVALIERGIIVADAVGRLYYFNTMGAALACLSAGFLIFSYIGLVEVLWFAAALNFIIVLLGFFLRKKWL